MYTVPPVFRSFSRVARLDPACFISPLTTLPSPHSLVCVPPYLGSGRVDQVSFGVLSLLDSPLFHIYVLGREAKGNLARPFKKQGLMASLSGPMEAMSAKVV